MKIFLHVVPKAPRALNNPAPAKPTVSYAMCDATLRKMFTLPTPKEAMAAVHNGLCNTDWRSFTKV